MMRRMLLLFVSFLPCIMLAQIPSMHKLGKAAGKVKGVEHASVGRFMLGMASAFADKEEREVFKMIDNIEMIKCCNSEYTPSLSAKVMEIVDDAGASHLATQDEGKVINEVYAVHDGKIVSELIIVVKDHDGNFSVVAMSGRIPLERLDEISKIKPK